MSAGGVNTSDDQRRGYRGYVIARPFGGIQIPVPVQNLVLRDYAQRNGMLFKLPANEFVMPGCYLQLEGLFSELPRLEGIVMASYFMLPASVERRRKVYETVFDAGAELVFALEDVRVRDLADVEPFEDTLTAYHLLPDCPQEIVLDPMPVDTKPIPGWSAPAGKDWNPSA